MSEKDNLSRIGIDYAKNIPIVKNPTTIKGHHGGMVICTMNNMNNTKDNVLTSMRTESNIKSDRLNVEVSSYCHGYFGKMLCWLT